MTDMICRACGRESTFLTNIRAPFEPLKVKCALCGAEMDPVELSAYNDALRKQKKPHDSEMDRATDMLHKFYCEALGKNTHNPMTDALFQTWQAYRKAGKANGRQKKNRARHDTDQ